MKRLFTPLFAFGLMVLPGCNRTIVDKPLHVPYSTTDSTTVPSPDAYINLFVIKAVDNPGILKTDVAGAITFDKVRIVFDSGTNITNLIPTIGYIGKSLSPASLTPENFDSTLRYTLIATDGTVLSYRIEIAFQ